MFRSFIKYIIPLSILLFGGISGITELSAHMNGQELANLAYQHSLNGETSTQQAALIFTVPSQKGAQHHAHIGIFATKCEIELEEDENAGSKKPIKASDYFTAFDLLSPTFAETNCLERLTYYKQFSYALITTSLYLLIETFIL
jgi:hypothetical protein